MIAEGLLKPFDVPVVRVVSLGFGSDDQSKKVRAHFREGNAYTLKMLREKLKGKD